MRRPRAFRQHTSPNLCRPRSRNVLQANYWTWSPASTTKCHRSTSRLITTEEPIMSSARGRSTKRIRCSSKRCSTSSRERIRHSEMELRSALMGPQRHWVSRVRNSSLVKMGRRYFSRYKGHRGRWIGKPLQYLYPRLTLTITLLCSTWLKPSLLLEHWTISQESASMNRFRVQTSRWSRRSETLARQCRDRTGKSTLGSMSAWRAS